MLQYNHVEEAYRRASAEGYAEEVRQFEMQREDNLTILYNQIIWRDDSFALTPLLSRILTIVNELLIEEYQEQIYSLYPALRGTI